MINTPALPDVHIAVMQPAGYVHSLAFLDPARYVRWQLRRFGVDVTIAKNRLREDAVNLVFGAHLGFSPECRERHACVFVNLEQLTQGGAKVADEYLRLLKSSGVIDYDMANVGVYGADAADVPVIPFRHAPYLEPQEGQFMPLDQRPIDLLFFGSMNERRHRFIERVNACGVNVTVLDKVLYADERDAYIRQAKAVLNVHFYESATFEQVRAFHCLSLGTPVVSERCPHTRVDDVFDEVVTWVADEALEGFFTQTFGSAQQLARARWQLARWKLHDPVDAYADLMLFAAGYAQGHAKHKPIGPWRPTRINLGSGKTYRPGWLNLDVVDGVEPDLLLDLGKPQDFPVRATTRFGTPMVLDASSVDRVCADNVLEHVSDLPCLMGNVLKLLRTGAEIEIEVPYEKALTAWQDPTHVRAMNENSWVYYTEWFWYLGWFEHRFEVRQSSWLDGALRPCTRNDAAFMRVVLAKVETTDAERTVARMMRADFGLPDDAPREIGRALETHEVSAPGSGARLEEHFR